MPLARPDLGRCRDGDDAAADVHAVADLGQTHNLSVTSAANDCFETRPESPLSSGCAGRVGVVLDRGIELRLAFDALQLRHGNDLGSS